MDEAYRPPEFFGIPVLSNHVLFVIDVSGSMRLWDKGKEPHKDSKLPEWKTRQRLVRVKEQLVETIRLLPKQSHFNVIAFSDWVKPFQDRTVPANAKTKKKAIEFVEGLRPEGGTHTDDALVKAFEDKNVDTIVLLSDGCPSKLTREREEKQLMAEILETVRKKNTLLKIEIHTFGFEGDGELPPGTSSSGGKPDPDAPTPADFAEFMRKLAEDSGGKYTPVE